MFINNRKAENLYVRQRSAYHGAVMHVTFIIKQNSKLAKRGETEPKESIFWQCGRRASWKRGHLKLFWKNEWGF